MTNELSRTIATCAIWFATACIFTFGLFRMNGSTEFFVIVTLILASAAAVSTIVVWLPASAWVSGNQGAVAEKSSAQQGNATQVLPPSDLELGASHEHGITRRPGSAARD